MKLSAKQNIYTVSRLNREARAVLEKDIGQIWLEAEISNLIKAASGHWYFKLKDDKAQVSCAMFRGNNQRVHFAVKDGAQVLVRARVGLYEPRGDFQVLVEQMDASGEGALKQAFEALKFKLAAEGLFAQQNKQHLPASITRVGIVTSSSGAALHDIITVMQRRAPFIELVLYPSLVQGDTAAANVAAQIEKANSRNEVDVLIVGRGGGSLEDLYAFNEEPVARAIFASNIPIISAVGHEVDVTISDFTADLRAATPSAAAELVSQSGLEVASKIAQSQQHLNNALLQKLQNTKNRLSNLALRLQHQDPKRQLEAQQQKADELSIRLRHSMQNLLTNKQGQLHNNQQRLTKQNPDIRLQAMKSQWQLLQSRLHNSKDQLTQTKQHQLSLLAEKLNAFSPLATLNRGYSITLDNQGKAVTSKNQLKVGDSLSTKLTDACIVSEITSIDAN